MAHDFVIPQQPEQGRGDSGKTGVMICGHGSRSQAAVDEFAVLAKKLPATYFSWLYLLVASTVDSVMLGSSISQTLTTPLLSANWNL